jgi:hypothetical protein
VAIWVFKMRGFFIFLLERLFSIRDAGRHMAGKSPLPYARKPGSLHFSFLKEILC